VEGDTSLTVGPDCATAGVTNRAASRQNMPVEAFIIRYTVCDSKRARQLKCTKCAAVRSVQGSGPQVTLENGQALSQCEREPLRFGSDSVFGRCLLNVRITAASAPPHVITVGLRSANRSTNKVGSLSSFDHSQPREPARLLVSGWIRQVCLEAWTPGCGRSSR
jgi:hypothetical protein